MKRSFLPTLALFLTAIIWGLSFVAQSVGLDYVGPFTFMGVRTFMAGLALLPVIALLERGKPAAERRALLPLRRDKALLRGGVLCGVFLTLGSDLQQYALLYTTAGKCAFVSAFYVMFVPVFAAAVLRRRYRFPTWIGVGVSIVGFYLLCIRQGLSVGRGELLALLSAFFYAVQILLIDHYAARTDGVRLACTEFFVSGILSLCGMALFERPQLHAILAAWLPLLYSGLLSCGVGFTVQILCQKRVEPALASLVMSMESVFSALAGWLLLHELLTARELLGCALTFAAVVIVQLSPAPTPGKSPTP